MNFDFDFDLSALIFGEVICLVRFYISRGVAQSAFSFESGVN